MKGNVQHVVKQVSKLDGSDTDDFLEWSSKSRVSFSLYNKLTFKIVQGSQWPSRLDNDQATARDVFLRKQITICAASFTSLHPAQLFLSCGRSKEIRERVE